MKFPDVGGGKSADGKKGGLFIALKDGDKITGVFAGEPSIFKIHWIGQKSFKCIGRATCPHCQDGDKPKFRFKINFITKDDGVLIAKIFEGSYGTFLDLKTMHESDHDLSETQVTVSRRGLKAETRYTIMPTKAQPMPKELENIKKIPLNSLGEEKAEESFDQSSAVMTDSDIPF